MSRPWRSSPRLLDDTPEVARWNEEVALGKESLALAKAERIPDVDVSAGISRFEEDGTHAGTAGLSLPLPLFDRNAGGILAAKHQATRAEYEQRAARLRVTTDLVEAHSRLETARAEALTIKAELLPGAQQAFDAAQTGYREGKFGHLEVLDTQRTLSEAQGPLPGRSGGLSEGGGGRGTVDRNPTEHNSINDTREEHDEDERRKMDDDRRALRPVGSFGHGERMRKGEGRQTPHRCGG